MPCPGPLPAASPPWNSNAISTIAALSWLQSRVLPHLASPRHATDSRKWKFGPSFACHNGASTTPRPARSQQSRRRQTGGEGAHASQHAPELSRGSPRWHAVHMPRSRDRSVDLSLL
ncbi:hypothetical protein FKP32DRAFT_734734 [Trametes sanguinea]|nr:hypothetical protein FKP32DRAFT_734734 [Trametes sanguinea]